MTQKFTAVFAVFVMVLLMIATRGHDNWLSSIVHLPDFTLPALLIAGVYFRHFGVVFTLILSAVAIDNYAVIHQGISANCITLAYSVLPLTYYGVFWSGKYLNSLIVDKNIVKNSAIVVVAISTQWLVATSSYYYFTDAYAKTGWGDFPAYAAHWSVAEIPITLAWMAAVIIAFTLVPRIFPALNIRKSA
jgi:hypothetical protein